MALTMLDKKAAQEDRSEWPAELKAEFERESRNPNPCVGTSFCRKPTRSAIWIIRLRPGERIGFHRHVLNYFWTSVNGGRGRQHLMDGSTVEYSYYSRRDAPRDLRAGRVQGPRSREPRQRGHDLQHHRVPGQRQQAAAGTGWRSLAALSQSSARGHHFACNPNSVTYFSLAAEQTSQAAAHPAHCGQQAFGET